jgi:hypothetical protein
MSSKSWLAIDVGTAPMLRAQELRFAWEQFVAGLGHDERTGADPDDVREPIVESWRRSFAAGIDPVGHQLAPVVADEDETQMLWEEHPLARAAPLIHECLGRGGRGRRPPRRHHRRQRRPAERRGQPQPAPARGRPHELHRGHAVERARAGTNAIGTAIAADHAVQVFGPEHFNEVVQRWTCSAAPIHDPDSGDLLGVIDLTGDFSTVPAPQPRCRDGHRAGGRGVAAPGDAGARPAPARPLFQQGRRRARLARAGHPQRPPDHDVPASWGSTGRLAIPPGGGPPDAALRSHRDRGVGRPGGGAVPRPCRGAPRAARPPGRSCACSCSAASGRCSRSTGPASELRPRLGEILAVLCAHPEGRSADALCADLHGDEGRAASVRVEVSRLRKLLGPWIDTERYRLTCDVETDVRRVEGLLRAGAVREAAEEYPGPLLPGSEAPAIVEAREQLDAWLRQAVMTASDREACGRGSTRPRPRRPRRVEALLLAARVPRSAPQPVRGARRRAAPLADLSRPPARCSARVTLRW